MHARAITVKIAQTQSDTAIAHLETLIDELKMNKGLRDVYVLVDRARGELMTFTVWDSEEDLQASLGFAREAFGQISTMTVGDPVIKMMEVAIHESGVPA